MAKSFHPTLETVLKDHEALFRCQLNKYITNYRRWQKEQIIRPTWCAPAVYVSKSNGECADFIKSVPQADKRKVDIFQGFPQPSKPWLVSRALIATGNNFKLNNLRLQY